MERTRDERRDLISDLPEPILHHIMSYLSHIDSTRTSVLSKQWNSARISSPILEFELPQTYTALETPQLKERLRKFVGFVDRSLQHFAQNKLCIDRMELTLLRIGRDSVPLVNTWLPLALHNGVSDLYFFVNVAPEEEEDNDSNYRLPETSFAVNSSLLCGSAEFFRLEKLNLTWVDLSENIVSDIIRNCPKLRHLCVWEIRGLKALKISKPNKLESLSIVPKYSRELKCISVDADSIEDFSFCSHEDDLRCVIDLTSCGSLRKLELCNIFITNSLFHQHISRFPFLEVLDLSTCNNLKKITISLQRLKHLRVRYCARVKAIEIDTPVLSSFDFTPRRNLPISVSSKVIPCSMYISTEMYGPFDKVISWSLKLREYEGINFYPSSYGIKLNIDHDKSREAVISPWVKVGILDLTGLRNIGSSHWATLLDGLLSICHPRIVSMTSDSLDGDNCVKILCKMLMQSECQLCSNLPHCKCWRQFLKAAEIESINGIKLSIESVRNIKHEQFLHVLDTSSIPVDSDVRFGLLWDLSAIEGHRIDLLDRFSISSY